MPRDAVRFPLLGQLHCSSVDRFVDSKSLTKRKNLRCGGSRKEIGGRVSPQLPHVLRIQRRCGL